MTFPLGSASLLLLLCELWCLGRALLTNTTTTTGSPWLRRAQALVVARQFIRWLLIQNKHRSRHIDTHGVSLSHLPSFTFSLSHSYTHKHKNSQIWQSQITDTQKKKTECGQRECVCQLFLTSFSVSSKVWGAHKVLLPIWQHFQSPNTELGLFQRLRPDGSLPSMLLSSLTSSLDTAHVSSRALVLEIRIASKHQATHRARALFAHYHILSLCVCWPSLVTLLVLMRTWLCPVCVGRQRHTLWSHSGSFN